MVKGYTNLLITRTNGFTSIPVASEMLRTSKDKNVLRAFDKSIDNRSSGGRRRADAKTRKPKLLIRLCKSILNKEIKAQYILMDTWFLSDALIATLNELSLDSICMIKKNLKFALVGETQKKDLKQILSSLHQRCNTKQIISSTIVQTKSGQQVKPVFVRNRNNLKEFISLFSTDTRLFSEK